MPLPAALAARLQKRGIIKGTHTSSGNHEEVFAENYDNDSDQESSDTTTRMKSSQLMYGSKYCFETADCPNRSNEYHNCSEYCIKRYGLKKFRPEPIMDRRRIKMLKKHPIPPGWVEVADPNTGRFYYWNSGNDKVSWFPPTHPKCRMMFSEKKNEESLTVNESRQIHKRKVSMDSNSDRIINNEDEEDDDHPDFEELERDILREKHEQSIINSSKREQITKQVQHKHLDPMDPSSYSDVARGKWSDGLEIGAKRKKIDDDDDDDDVGDDNDEDNLSDN